MKDLSIPMPEITNPIFNEQQESFERSSEERLPRRKRARLPEEGRRFEDPCQGWGTIFDDGRIEWD